MTKRQRSGFFVLVLIIVVLEVIIQWYPKWVDKEVEQAAFTPTEEAMLLKMEAEEPKKEADVPPQELSIFNPNALDVDGFMALDFSRKQSESLIKYRYSLGGNFSSIEEFGEAYVISDEKLEELRPYIRIEEVVENERSTKSYPNRDKNTTSKRVKLKPFYPNELTHNGWMELGFSERQAQVILNFKNSLPNKRFENAEQIHACYAINDYMFNKIAPYIRFREQKGTVAKEETAKTNVNSKMNPNEMTAKDWENLGFTNEEADGIIKYNDFIGGYKSIEDLRKCTFVTDKDIVRIQESLEFK